SRGLDIDQLPYVVNFDLPNVPEDYVHRIGRTGRAGNDGRAISLVSEDETAFLKDIEKLLKRKLEKTVVEGYELHTPASSPVSSPKAQPQAANDSSNSSKGQENEQRRKRPRRRRRRGGSRGGSRGAAQSKGSA
ncbi:MAG: helicase-related protein, partial [Cyanobacteria bacterium P01_A01_bin.135]